jgi:rSAM/selenodomain-associated transferase 2
MMLSIIIPIYNEEKNLPTQLTFLQGKAKQLPIEIVISNSPDTTDKSPSICKQFSRVKFFESDTKGRAIQMNYGASKATGDILLFLHADVKLPDDFYEQVTQAIMEGHKMGFFSYKFDRSTFMLNVNSYFTKNDGVFAGAGDQCQFFTKETFEKLGRYNEEFCIMEDFEMMDKVRKQNIPYTIVQSKATVSARKYNKASWLEVNAINGYVFLLYKLGKKPRKLREVYKGLLRESV